MKYKFTPEENAARQEALYSFLLSRGDRWTSMEQTTDTIPEYPAFFTGHYHNSWARRMLTKDIEQINAGDSHEKIIISTSRGIKLATEEEFYKFLVSELREVFSKLSRIRKLSRKGSRNLQLDLECKITNAFLQRGE